MNRKILLKITDKWPAKVLSVAAALIISVFYRLNMLDTKVLSVPLNIVESNQFTSLDSYEQSVRITIRGDSNIILPITENDIEAYIDFGKYTKEGTYRIPVQVRKKNNALGIEPMEISVSPMEIYMTLEEKITRTIPVYPVFSGTIAQNYDITSQSIVPEQIIAEGPRSSIENIKEFFTETIDLEGRNRSFTALVLIKNDNPNISIRGQSRIIQYNCIINPIERVFTQINIPPYAETTDEPQENFSATENYLNGENGE